MSLTASSLLARLEELKKWQEKQQERLSQQQSIRTEISNNSSNYNTIEGLSQFDSTLHTTKNTSRNCAILGEDVCSDSERKKNACNVHTGHININNEKYKDENGSAKPKKPFLKRGSGLVRFKMNPGDQNRPFNEIIKKKSNLKSDIKCVNDSDKIIVDKSCNFEITPLKRPDVNIKAVWCKVGNEKDELIEHSSVHDCIPEILPELQINQLAPKENKQIHHYLQDKTQTESIGVTRLEHGYPSKESNPIEKIPTDQSLYEKQLERELLIFEALEEKVLNSSFSSTNSSVLRILSSTPSKIKARNIEKKTINEEHRNEVFEEHGLGIKTQEHINIQNDQGECDTSPKINSLESSVTSEDFQEKLINKLQFNDDAPWSDINSYTRENSSLSSASTRSNQSSQKEDTLVIEQHNMVTKISQSEIDESKEILAKKIKELDDEICNFRKENAKLRKAKLKLENEQKEFKKEKKAFEKFVLEEKINVEFYLEDEKKKLTKEKMIFDRYVKDVHNKTTRKEREEISSLKEEIANLKEASKLKETRNATSQARLRNQIKSFEKEIANSKEELEKLRKQNAKLTANQRLNKKTTDTKMLHEINKNLSRLTKDTKVTEQLKKMEESMEKKKVLLDSFEKEVDSGKSPDNNKDIDFFYGNDNINSDHVEESTEYNENARLYGTYDNFLKNRSKKDGPDLKSVTENCNDDVVQSSTNTSLERNYEMVFSENKLHEVQNKSMDKDKGVINETVKPDGSKELIYPNGNVKSISADGNTIFIKYFNGDTKETKLLEGVIRYYYAESQSWQITMPDGEEILEFVSGQIEKKYKDRTKEVKFPNGIVHVTRLDGSQSITYPDNTRVDIDSEGVKIISLPNGQREIHNQEHMRREYPDGTVKILYPDGLQETRYHNGRIRIKDKAGSLILDSHDDNT